jgi:hypothetical protein
MDLIQYRLVSDTEGTLLDLLRHRNISLQVPLIMKALADPDCYWIELRNLDEMTYVFRRHDEVWLEIEHRPNDYLPLQFRMCLEAVAATKYRKFGWQSSPSSLVPNLEIMTYVEWY